MKAHSPSWRLVVDFGFGLQDNATLLLAAKPLAEKGPKGKWPLLFGAPLRGRLVTRA